MKRRALLGFLSVLTCLFAVSCGPSGGSKDQSSASSKTFRFVFTPSVDTARIRPQARKLVEFLEKETGHRFEALIPGTYEEAIEAFGSGEAHMGLLNSFGYLVANRKYGVEAYMKSIRKGQAYYRGQIIVRADSGIDSLQNLDGKKFAFTSKTSSSGFLLPSKMLKDVNVTLGEALFVGKHDKVVDMVYTGQADGGATYYDAPGPAGEIRDARERLLETYPDVVEKVKILVVTNSIPNEPIAFAKSVSEEDRQAVIDAIFAYVSRADGKMALMSLYDISNFDNAKDSDYDILRIALEANQIDIERFLR